MVGCQLRYLINSDHGWLGGFAFSAAALNLRDRDQWMGWDTEQHRTHLHRVLGMSRFLLRTSVHCHNLASCVLGMVLRQVGPDFEAQYGYRPWLVESFVDTEHFLGTCYKATNWIDIGKTQGRGRQDRENKKPSLSKPSTSMRLSPSGAPGWGWLNRWDWCHWKSAKGSMQINGPHKSLAVQIWETAVWLNASYQAPKPLEPCQGAP
ncbi:MAG: DUF4338 domain-containing protein [Rhodoferax sp.]|nr:DUF4338 domain-containing protein [Rhodoferax sp.]